MKGIRIRRGGILGALALLLAPVLGAGPAVAAAGDGTWYQYTQLPRYGHSAVYDPVHQRMLVLGGQATRPINDVRALSLSGPFSWSRLDAPGSLLPDLNNIDVALYDSVGDRIITFNSSTYATATVLSTTAPTTWSTVPISGTPPPYRSDGSWVMDPVAGRILLFGGLIRPLSGPDYRNDVWALDLSSLSWQQILPSVPLPGGRYGAAIAYDQARDRLVIFGGYGTGADPFAPPGYLNDAWELELSPSPQWTLLSPAGVAPSPGMGTGLFDAPRDRMLIFRGSTMSVLDFAPSPAWGTPESVPGAPDYSVVLDGPAQRLVVFGGSGIPASADIRTLDLATDAWFTYPFTDYVPDGTVGANLVFDPPRNRALLITWASDVSAFDFDDQKWSLLAPTGAPPGTTSQKSAFYDGDRDRVIIYGSFSGTMELWTLTLSGVPHWSQLTLNGAVKPPWTLALAYDPARNRLIAFYPGPGTWVLDLDQPPEWVSLSTAGTPPPTDANQSFAGVYDALGDRYVVSGGSAMSGGMNGSWTLDLPAPPTWSNIVPRGSAPLTCTESRAYDSDRARVAIFGGATSVNGNSDHAYTLGLDGASSWTQLAPLGVWPDERRGHAMTYDPVNHQLLVFGGTQFAVSYYGDLWGLIWGPGTPPSVSCNGDSQCVPGATAHLGFTLENSSTFAENVSYRLESPRGWPGFPMTGLAPVPAGGSAILPLDVAVPDTAAGGVQSFTLSAVFMNSGQPASCTAALTVTLGVPSPGARLALARSGRNPGPDLAYRVTLPDAAPRTLEVFDLAGRRVFGRDVGTLGAGTHVVVVEGVHLAPGLYLARLTGAGHGVRAVVIR